MSRHINALLLGLTVASATAACGPVETEEEALFRTAVDLRLPMPQPDPKYVDFVGLDTVIKPGEDKMVCVHIKHEGPAIAYDVAETMQSKFGHHFILLKAKDPKPAGSVEDCSKAEDMAKYDVLTIPEFELAAGQGFYLESGTPMVMQSHYVNTSREPIRIRDILRIHKVDPSSVKTWAATFALASLKYDIKPFERAKYTFDCTMPSDQQLIMIGGHMHEWGTKFSFAYGDSPTGTMKEIYKVDTWRAEYRDAPPTTLLRDKPLLLAKGTALRTECQWFNDTMQPLDFPHEMCSTFGVVLDTKENWSCILDK